MNLFDLTGINLNKTDYKSPYEMQDFKSFEEMQTFFDSLNQDLSHKMSQDDVCTPMLCVKKMLDYVPEELWRRKSLKILDPCAGNGNFGAYASLKTKLDNIYFNELNYVRYANTKAILNPKHVANCNAFSLNEEFDILYDLVMANPPYSGGGNKNQSLSNQFIELGIDLLKDNGYLCFITPNNWMTYNSKNPTLKKLLSLGSFIVIDNDAKKYFSGVGSSFTIIVWQKNVFSNKTYIKNNYLLKDEQFNVTIPSNLKYLPLYISQTVLDIVKKLTAEKENGFNYRCDLHNFTKKELLSDIQDDVFKYPTIHTARKTRYAKIKQNIFDKNVIIIPLSTYCIPYIVRGYNTTQSVGYFAFETENEAKKYKDLITRDPFKAIIHLTRYGNFNNIMVLKHLDFNNDFKCLTDNEKEEISFLVKKINY
jgi:hypothetical protein